MLKLEITVHDQMWPQLVITISRQSYRGATQVQQEKKQYDLAYVKAEEMVHNHLRPLVEELIQKHFPDKRRVGEQ